MKLAVTCLASVSGLSCWTCNGVDPNQCKLEQCPQDGQVYACQNEIRMYGDYVKFQKGCQQKQACLNNALQNEVSGTDYYQCNPYRKRDSVCRCCCHTDGCNELDHFCAKPPHCRKPIVANGEFNCTAETMEPGAQCTVKCYQGYQTQGPDTIECTDQEDTIDGLLKWSHMKWPTCQPLTCNDELPKLENGQIKCWNGDQVGKHCSVQCDTGYELSSDSESTVLCGSDQQWIGAPKCIKTPTCEKRQIDLTAQFVSCSNGNRDGSICHFSCDSGFELVGARSVDCYEGDWSANFPTCEPTCTPQFEGNRRNVKCSNNYAIESTCTFNCKDGSRLRGAARITCEAVEEKFTLGLGGNTQLATDFDVTISDTRIKANWNAPSPICEPITCPKLEPNDFITADCSSNDSVGSVCRFKCEEGYKLDYDEIECEKNGAWSRAVPECKQVTKKPVLSKCDKIDSGILSLKCSNDFFLGSECNFVCPNGYTVDGQKSTTCLKSFKWSQYTLPGCLYRVRLTRAQAAQLSSMDSYIRSTLIEGVEPKSSESGDVELDLTGYIADLKCNDFCTDDSKCAAKIKEDLGVELEDQFNLYKNSKCNQ